MTDAELWCALNRGEWQPELGPEPDDHRERHKIIWPRMVQIMGRIGIKECLREWNREEMPGAVFDEWWQEEGARVTPPIVGTE